MDMMKMVKSSASPNGVLGRWTTMISGTIPRTTRLHSLRRHSHLIKTKAIFQFLVWSMTTGVFGSVRVHPHGHQVHRPTKIKKSSRFWYGR